MALSVENLDAADDSGSEIDPKYHVKLRADRLNEIIARRDKEQQERTEKRRAGRPLGELTPSLIEKLRACNVAQLKTAKKLCDDYIQDHRKPPSRYMCGKPFTTKVLQSVTVKNCRYQLEFRRAKQVYVYLKVCVYWRDGSIIHLRTIKQDKYLRRALPKKVWGIFKGHFDNPQTELVRQKLIEEVRSSHAN
jgi:hypothetical protein